MDFLDKIKLREPEYDEKYYDFILKFTSEQGASMGRSTEEEQYELGKYFSTRYEMYMYATLLGLRKGYKVPLEKGTNKRSFIAINSWKPTIIADYIIMSVLALGDYDFFKLEELDIKELEKIITTIKNDIEAYANGGFEIIYSKSEEDEAYFVENENSFIDLLDE